MSRETYVLDGSKQFDFNHPVADASQLTLWVQGGSQVPAADYRVSGAGATSVGVTIYWEDAPTDNSTLVVSRETPAERVTDFVDDKAVPVASLNSEFDRIYGLLVEAETARGRMLRLKDSDPTPDSSIFLPAKSDRLGKYLSFDDSGMPKASEAPLFSDADLTAKSVSALRAASVEGVEDGSTANLLGYNGIGTPGGGPLYWDASSTATDNGGTIFKPDSIDAADPGRWIRRIDAGIVTPQMFGAAADGVTDDTAAFESAPEGAFIPAGSYNLTGDVSGTFLSGGGVEFTGSGKVDALSIPSAARFARQKEAARTEVIAHRGFNDVLPENTLYALSKAVEIGADSVEFDVQISSDGVLYLFHDSTVDNKTDGTGTFTSLSESTINGLTYDTYFVVFGGLGITPLSDVLGWLKQVRVPFYPEVKAIRTTADIATMVDAVQSAGLSELCVWQSFTFSHLEEVKASDPVCGIAHLIGSGETQASLEGYVDALSAYSNAFLACESSNYITHPSVVGYAKQRGVGVIAYRPETREEITTLLELGVNRIISDRPERIK